MATLLAAIGATAMAGICCCGAPTYYFVYYRSAPTCEYEDPKTNECCGEKATHDNEGGEASCLHPGHWCEEHAPGGLAGKDELKKEEEGEVEIVETKQGHSAAERDGRYESEGLGDAVDPKFDDVDADHDGVLTQEEWAAASQRIGVTVEMEAQPPVSGVAGLMPGAAGPIMVPPPAELPTVLVAADEMVLDEEDNYFDEGDGDEI